MSFAVSIAAVSFLTTESSWRYYFMGWFVISFSSAVLLQKAISFHNSKRSAAAVIALTAAVILYAGLQWNGNLRSNLAAEEPNGDTEAIVNWMQENGYDYAYSTFETSNRMTISCDGAVQISAVSGLDSMGINKWLTDENWYCPLLPYEMDTAYVIPKSLLDVFVVQLELHDDYELVMETENYYLYTAPHNYSVMD